MRLLAAIILLFLAYPARSLIITEIMYNPVQDDSTNEWIEIYNNDSEINLENFTACGSVLEMGYVRQNDSQTYANTTFVLASGAYAVITDGGTGTQAYDNFNISGLALHVSSSAMCTGLANSGDTITVEHNSIAQDSVTYADIAAEGMAICRNQTGFYQCQPTPGIQNIQQSQAGQSQPSTSSCSLSLSIGADKIYSSDTSINFYLIVNDTNCTGQKDMNIEYSIEDLFGDKAKETLTTQQSMSCYRTIDRQWTTPAITGTEAYLIKASIASASCSDESTADNTASMLIVVKGTKPVQVTAQVTTQASSSSGSAAISGAVIGKKESSIKISKAGAAVFGKMMEVELDVYRGETMKNAVNVFVESGGAKVSETTNFNARTRFTSYNLSIPVLLKEGCGAGKYTLIAEGLDTKDEKTIEIAAAKGCTKKNGAKVTARNATTNMTLFERLRATGRATSRGKTEAPDFLASILRFFRLA